MKNHRFLYGNVLIIISLFLNFSLHSQTNTIKPDARLFQCYSKQYVDNLLKTNPEQISYLNYYLDNSYYIVSLKSEKPIEGIDIHTLISKSSKIKFSEITYSKGSFNILKYNFYFSNLSALTYIWKEAGIAIVLLPEKHIKENYKVLKNN